MSRASNSKARRSLGNAGVTTLEFALVAMAFLGLVFVCIDLGRYYVIEASLRTFVSEAARTAQIESNASINPNGSWSGSSVPAGLSAIVPLIAGGPLSLFVFQQGGGGTNNYIYVQAGYNFQAFSPLWTSLNGQITESTQLSY